MDDTHALEIGSGFSCAVFRRNLWTACHLLATWRCTTAIARPFSVTGGYRFPEWTGTEWKVGGVRFHILIEGTGSRNL